MLSLVTDMASGQPQQDTAQSGGWESWKTSRSFLRRLRLQSLSGKTKHKNRPGITQGIWIGRTSQRRISSETKPIISINSIEEPRVQRALVVARKGEYEIRDDFPVPSSVGGCEVMIRSRYVGLNPIDWKSVDYSFCLPEFPWVTGREMSGVVEKVGKDVTHVSPGDKVWTSTYYKDVRAGCFQQYVVVPQHTVSRVPQNLSMESAACLGVPGLTASMTLWKWLDVPLPRRAAEASELSKDADDDWILIWGGSTITGQFATQIASLCGLKVITVNSAETKPLSERLGASYVISRDGKADDELVGEIMRATNGGHITRAVDVVGSKTAALVLRAVSQSRPVHFAPLAFMASSQVVPEHVTAHTVEMKRYVLDESNRRYSEELNRLLETGTLVLPEIHVLDGGFDDIQRGLDILKRGNLRGKKLVVKI